MTFGCKACGMNEFSHFSVGEKLVLVCDNCSSESTVVGATLITESGVEIEASAAPESVSAVGNDSIDPWVWFRARMKRSQREVVQLALEAASDAVGKCLHVGTAMEYMAADFLASSRG